MNGTEGTCVICGKTFVIPINCPAKIYCSPNCRRKAWKKRNPEKIRKDQVLYRKRRFPKPKPIKRLCPICHQEFLTNIHRPAQTFCSSNCRQKFYRIVNSKKISQQKKEERQHHKKYYQDSNDFYHNKIRFGGNRHLALERDGFKCVWCGRDRTEVRLVVHHKDGKGPNKPSPNHELSNLVTLCRSCHRKAHDILAT